MRDTMNIDDFSAHVADVENNIIDAVPSKKETPEALEVMYTIDALISEAENDEDFVRVESLKRIQKFVREVTYG